MSDDDGDVVAQLANANRKIRELSATTKRLLDYIVQLDADRAPGSNQPLADFLPLKQAAGLAGCETEYARRLAIDQRKVIFERDGPRSNIRVSLSSLVREVRKVLGLRRPRPQRRQPS